MGERIRPGHVFALLSIFWIAWLYTEVSEYIEREEFIEEMMAFKNRGSRNTAEQGYELCKRIVVLEKRLDVYNAITCDEIYYPTEGPAHGYATPLP